MENKRQQSGASSFDHIFGPRGSSSSSSSLFGSIFSSSSTVLRFSPLLSDYSLDPFVFCACGCSYLFYFSSLITIDKDDSFMS